MAFDRGYSSPYFITDQERRECSFDHPFILLTDRKISSVTDLVPVLEAVSRSGRPLVIIAEDVDGEALATLVVNKTRGVLQVAAVKAPGFGERRKAMLQDIAVLTGGTVISEDRAMGLAKATLEDLGQAERITIGKDVTTILAREDRKPAIDQRIASVKRELEVTESEYDREKLAERIAKLAGGVAVIRVGAPTETELRNRKLRIEDALNATRAAVEEGIIPGGGTVLLALADDLEGLLATLSGDQITGVRLIQAALKEPVRQIASNAGANGDVVVEKIRREGKGFNALTGTYEDLLSTGILDPAKVVRLALQDAVSIASLILTTEAIIADRPEPASAPSAGDGMGGMGCMGGMGGMGMPGMM
jgi:chaperonin GroEL